MSGVVSVSLHISFNTYTIKWHRCYHIISIFKKRHYGKNNWYWSNIKLWVGRTNEMWNDLAPIVYILNKHIIFYIFVHLLTIIKYCKLRNLTTGIYFLHTWQLNFRTDGHLYKFFKEGIFLIFHSRIERWKEPLWLHYILALISLTNA